ncbi:hypothetical protein [Streptomyces sp. NPDC093568]|uniref:hypothetical protein n=1 Tax=Streptomyces sp. NPDC093568 TaxID=3366041 RepID=UPI00381BEA43
MTTTVQCPAAAPIRESAWIPGCSFLAGFEDFRPEERLVHPMAVDGFWMDEPLQRHRPTWPTGHPDDRSPAALSPRSG